MFNEGKKKRGDAGEDCKSSVRTKCLNCDVGLCSLLLGNGGILLRVLPEFISVIRAKMLKKIVCSMLKKINVFEGLSFRLAAVDSFTLLDKEDKGDQSHNQHYGRLGDNAIGRRHS